MALLHTSDYTIRFPVDLLIFTEHPPALLKWGVVVSFYKCSSHDPSRFFFVGNFILNELFSVARGAECNPEGPCFFP